MEPMNLENFDASRKNIEWYLLTWLQPLKPGENPQQYIIDGKIYYQIMGFRRGFCIHAVFREINGDTFAFNVDDPCVDVDYHNFKPNMGVYGSFAELLIGVTNFYYERWNH
jgi:hypothetical protein